MCETCLKYLFLKQFSKINRNNERYIRYLWFIPKNPNVRQSQNIPYLNLFDKHMVTKNILMRDLIEF